MLVPKEIHCKYSGNYFVLSKALAVIMSMITDQIGRYEVSLPTNHKNYNFREKKNSQDIKESENVH